MPVTQLLSFIKSMNVYLTPYPKRNNSY